MRLTNSSVAALALLPLALFCGCGLAPTSSISSGSSPASGLKLGGSVHGGQQPVSGATVQLWQVGTTGYGSGAAPLGSSVTTAADGSFSITGAYNCASATNGANSLVYITATGGNPGLSAGTNNDALVMMTALGTCGSLTPSTFISINEVTTVASIYALAQFMSPTGNIGSPSFSTQGLANAFGTVSNIVNTTGGAARALTPKGNGIVPQAEINTLANILAPCINSANSSSTSCVTLFGLTPSTASVAPANVLTATLNMALNPGQSVGALFNQAATIAPFQPTLSVAPNDWTLAVAYATGGANPSAIAVDSIGNIWISNYAGGGPSSVSMITPQGVPAINSPFSGFGGLNGGFPLAIDTNNNVWVGNNGNNTALKLNSTFNGNNYTINTVAGPFSGIGLNSPIGIAIDGSNNVWFANSGNNTVLEIPGGIVNSNLVTYSGGGLNSPRRIAIDSNGNAWVTNANGGSISVINPNGVANPPANYTGGGITSPLGVAIDNSGSAWITDLNLGQLSRISSSGTPISPSNGYTGGGLTLSTAVAIDGTGKVWAADRTTNAVSEFAPAGTPITPATGYQGGSLATPTAMALDPSGNIWLANQSPVTNSGLIITVSEFVGLASPVITPQAHGVQTAQLGQRPGTTIPIAISSTILPLYSTSIGYNAQLYATGGNSGTFVWSTSSPLPTGLSFSSSGLISGSSTQTGTSVFTATVCDAKNATNCASHAFTLASAGTLSARGNEAALNGTYAVRFSGFRNTGGSTTPGAVYGTSFIGSLTFNGAGVITGGEFDSVAPNNASANSFTGVTGTYSLGSDNRGLISLPQSGNRPIELSIAVGNFSGPVAQTIHFIEFDDTQATTGGAGSAVGSGLGKLQTASAFNASTLGATFVFGFAGESPCTNYNNTNPTCPQTVGGFGPVSVVGYMTGSGGSITGSSDGAVVGVSINSQAFTGTYGAPDSFGRGLITFVNSALLGANYPTHFVYYIVNSGEMFLQSIDGHLNYSMVGGDALLQTPGFFNAGNPNPLSGPYVAYQSVPKNGDGVSFYPTQTEADLFLISASGSQLTVTSDQDKAGYIQLNQNIGVLPYSVDAHGRMPLGSGSPVFYLASASQGFATQQPTSSTDNPGLLTLQQQTGGPFSVASINGSYAFADLPPAASTGVNTGVITSTGTGTTSTIGDEAFNYGVLQIGQTSTATLTVAANGRGISTDAQGNTSVFYAISPGESVSISTQTSSAAPTITYLQR